MITSDKLINIIQKATNKVVFTSLEANNYCSLTQFLKNEATQGTHKSFSPFSPSHSFIGLPTLCVLPNQDGPNKFSLQNANTAG